MDSFFDYEDVMYRMYMELRQSIINESPYEIDADNYYMDTEEEAYGKSSKD